MRSTSDCCNTPATLTTCKSKWPSPRSATRSAWARYSLQDLEGARAGRDRKEQHLSRLVHLRVRETDTAVDLALADLRRERGQ